MFPLPAGVSPYGITVDHEGRVWVSSTAGAGAARFDPTTEAWDIIGGFSSLGGLAEDDNNTMWIADNDGMVSVEVDTLQFGPRFLSPHGQVKGVSVDVDGFVWAVDNRAHKVDPSLWPSSASTAACRAPIRTRT